MKKDLIEFIKKLLISAESRESEQGVLVFQKLLERLEATASGADVTPVLQQLNQALAGIEAHGELTDEEYQWAEQLRAMEKEL